MASSREIDAILDAWTATAHATKEFVDGVRLMHMHAHAHARVPLTLLPAHFRGHRCAPCRGRLLQPP